MEQDQNIKVEFENLGTVNKNSVTIRTDKGTVNLYFSYNTLIGVNNVVSVNDWSKTTGKFLNELQPDKSKRVEHSQVLTEAEKQLKNVLFSTKSLIIEKLTD